MTKRWLSLVLVLTLMSSLFAGGAMAAPVRKGNPVLSFVPAKATTPAVGGQQFRNVLMGEFRQDGGTNFTPAQLNAISTKVAEADAITYSVPADFAAYMVGNRLYASFNAPTLPPEGMIDAEMKFKTDFEVPDFSCATLSEKVITTVSIYTALTTLTLAPATLTLDGGVGDTETLVATVNPNAAEVEYVWESSAPSIVEVVQDDTDANEATVTAVAEGKATITVTAKNKLGTKKATCVVTVAKKDSTGVTVDSFGPVYAGERKTLTATIAPSGTTDSVKSWSSSDTSVATIDDKGVLTPIKAGTTIVTVTTAYGKTAAPSLIVEEARTAVAKPDITASDLTKATANVTIETATVGASIYYTMTTADEPAAEPLTAENAATVGTLYTGAIALTKNTTYTVNAIAVKSGLTAAKADELTRAVTIAVTDVTLNRTTMTVNGKAEVVLTATVVPANANVTDITWEPANTTGTHIDEREVSSDKKSFKIKTTGDADVTVRATVAYNDGAAKTDFAECVITVNPVVETKVTASPTELFVAAGEWAELKAVVTPANATAQTAGFYYDETSTIIDVEGAIDGGVENVASIKIKGLATGVGKSETITLVTENGLRTTCKVTVTAASGKVSAPVFDTADGKVFTSGIPANRHVKLSCPTDGATIKYTVNGGVAQTYNPLVADYIELVANQNSVIVAWAESGDLLPSNKVKATFVSAVAVDDVALTGDSTIIGKGTATVTAELTSDQPGVAPKNQNVSWKSSDTSVATVEANELVATVTALKPGKTTITVTTEDGKKTATQEITVTEVTYDAVKIFAGNDEVTTEDDEEVTVTPGESRQLTLKVYNAGSEVTGKTPFAVPVWTSTNNAIATVNTSNRVSVPATATATSEATITVKLGATATASGKVIVGAPTTVVAGVELAPAAGAQTAEITVTATTATTDAKLYYTLDGSTPSVTSTPFPSAGLTLNKDTNLRVGAFKSPLTPAYAAAAYTFNIPVTEVKLAQDAITMTKGDVVTLNATVTPAIATDKEITWSIVSGDAYATLDSATGVLTAKGVGAVTVKATAGGIDSANCVVTIEDFKATRITLAPAKATISIGEFKTLVAMLTPAGLEGKTIEWSTSDEFVATVDDGVVLGRKAGTATITATVDGVKATATITVEGAPAVIPAEPKKAVTFTPVAKEFQVIEGGSLSAVLGKLQPGEGETIDQIMYFYNVAVTGDITGVNEVYDIAKDGTITLNIANVGSTSRTFDYAWSLSGKTIPGFAANSDVTASGRTIYDNELKVIVKPTDIYFSETTVADFEMKGSEKKEVVVGTIVNYADFVASEVEVKATVTGVDKGATAAIAADGTVTVTVTEIAKGEHTIVVTLTAAGCDPVKTTGFKVTVTEDPIPSTKAIKVTSSTKPYETSYKKKPVYVLAIADGTVTFSVPGYTATGWKSNYTKLLSIDANGVATLKKGGATRITVTATLSDGTKVTQLVVIRKIASEVKLQYKSGKKWVDFSESSPLTIGIGTKKKVLTRAFVVTPAGGKVFAPKWEFSNPAIAFRGSKGYINGSVVGESIVTYELYNGVKATGLVIVSASKTADLIDELDLDVIEELETEEIEEIVEVEDDQEIEDVEVIEEIEETEAE